MFTILHSWQFYVIINIIFDVIFTQSYKFAVKDSQDNSAATILIETIAALTILVLTPFFPIQFPTNPILYLLLLTSVIFLAINDRLKTTARKFLPASESAILNQLTYVFIIFIGLTIFRQPIILTKIIGALLILGANTILVFAKDKFQLNKYFLYFLVGCAATAISISLDIGVSKSFNIPIYISFGYLFSAILIYLFGHQNYKKIKNEFRPANRLHFILTGLGWSVSFFAVIRAAQLGPISIVIPICATSVLANVLVASFIHRETQNVWKKVIAAAIVIGGITLTVIH